MFTISSFTVTGSKCAQEHETVQSRPQQLEDVSSLVTARDETGMFPVPRGYQRKKVLERKEGT